jgi:hypothetical protein
MQSLSLGLVTPVLLIAGLVIAFSIFASPLIAAVLFVIAFSGFLVWRGAHRAGAETGGWEQSAAPTSEEASADPVQDGGPAVVAGRHRP